MDAAHDAKCLALRALPRQASPQVDCLHEGGVLHLPVCVLVWSSVRRVALLFHRNRCFCSRLSKGSPGCSPPGWKAKRLPRRALRGRGLVRRRRVGAWVRRAAWLPMLSLADKQPLAPQLAQILQNTVSRIGTFYHGLFDKWPPAWPPSCSRHTPYACYVPACYVRVGYFAPSAVPRPPCGCRLTFDESFFQPKRLANSSGVSVSWPASVSTT